MKLHKLLTVNGEPYNITGDNIRLGLFNSGCAIFRIESDAAISGVVKFAMGMDPAALTPFFCGYIESCTTVDAKQQSLFCREFTGALNQRLPLAMRHCTLVDVLGSLYSTSKLPFKPADADYSKKPVAVVNSLGIGFQLMDQLGSVFAIDKYIWQQQADASIYVGSWNDSVFATRPINIPQKFLKAAGVVNKATIPALPALRPGTLFNGQYLTTLTFSGSDMQLTWQKNPWALRGLNSGS